MKLLRVRVAYLVGVLLIVVAGTNAMLPKSLGAASCPNTGDDVCEDHAGPDKFCFDWVGNLISLCIDFHYYYPPEGPPPGPGG